MSDRIRKLVSTSLVAVLMYAPAAQGYEYLRSNPINRTDPSGLFSTADLLTAQSWSAYLRTTGTLAGIGVGIVGVYGGFRSGFEAQLNGASAREIAIAAVKGAGYTGYNAFARVLLASAIISTGPGGLALAGGIGVYEAADAYGDARARQEAATTQAELHLATFDSVFASLAVGGSLYATSAGIRGAAIGARASLPPLPRGATGVWQGSFKGARFRADVVRNGTELQLNNVGIKGPIGTGGFKEMLEATKHVARAEGFTRIRVFGVRESGKTPGHWIDRVINVD